jgi:hypothetical protein
MEVFKASLQKDAPPEADGYYLPGMKKLVALCAELQIAAKSEPFCLSCRNAAELLGVDFHTSNRWLNRIEADGVLLRVLTGSMAIGSNGKRQANEYRYQKKPRQAKPRCSPRTRQAPP